MLCEINQLFTVFSMGTFFPLSFSFWDLSSERKDKVDHYSESVWKFLFQMFLPPSTLLTWTRWEEPTWAISSSQSSQSLVPFPAIPRALGFILGASATAWVLPSRQCWFSWILCPLVLEHLHSTAKVQTGGRDSCELHDPPNYFRPKHAKPAEKYHCQEPTSVKANTSSI